MVSSVRGHQLNNLNTSMSGEGSSDCRLWRKRSLPHRSTARHVDQQTRSETNIEKQMTSREKPAGEMTTPQLGRPARSSRGAPSDFRQHRTVVRAKIVDVEIEQNRRTNQLAWLVACAVVFGWGINFVLAKHALNQFSVGAFNFVRFGGMVALGWAVIAVTGGLAPIFPGDRRRLVLVAIVGFCGYVFGFSVGLSYTSAFSASLLLALVPLWVAFYTAVLAREAPPTASLLALGLAAVGTALFVGTRTSVSLGWGDAISLVVAALYAAYLLLNRQLVNRYAPFTLTTYAASIAAIPILLLTAPLLPNQDWAAVTVGG